MTAATPREARTAVSFKTFNKDLYRELPFSASPREHRRNLIYWVKYRRTRKHPTFKPYRLVRAYLAAIPDAPATARHDLITTLKMVFGPIAGAWLYGKLYTTLAYEVFETTMSGFAEPFVPHAPPSGYDVTQIKQQVKEERLELLRAQQQFRRDEQHANRVALIASLRSQAGPVAPRGYTQRWYRDHTKYQRYERVRNRFEHLFGDRAAATLDDPATMPRLLLARMLEDIDREEMKRHG